MVRELTLSKRDRGHRAQEWIALALCAAVVAAWIVAAARFVTGPLTPRPLPRAGSPSPPPGSPPPESCSGITARSCCACTARLLWSGLLLLVWAANGLPFDLLRIVRLIPLPVDWPGLATRTVALATAVVVACGSPSQDLPAPRPPATWGEPTSLAGTATPRSCSHCPTRLSGRPGRWAGRSASRSPARAALALPPGCLRSLG